MGSVPPLTSEQIQKREYLLTKILEHAPYSSWQRTGDGRLGMGEYRPADKENPGEKLDGLGLYNFSDKSKKSLWAVAEGLGIVSPKKSKEKKEKGRKGDKGSAEEQLERIRQRIAFKCSDEQAENWVSGSWSVIHQYFFVHRRLGLLAENSFSNEELRRFFRCELRATVELYKLQKDGKEVERCEIAIPLVNPAGEIVQLLKIEVDEYCKKVKKRQQLSCSGDRAIVFGGRDSNSNTYIFEGIEDALTHYFFFSERYGFRCIVSCGAGNFNKLQGFLQGFSESGKEEVGEKIGKVFVMLDNDKKQQSLIGSEVLGSEVIRLLPPAESEKDINEVLLALPKTAGNAEAFNALDNLLENLKEAEIEKVAEAVEGKEKERLELWNLADTQPLEYYRKIAPWTDSGTAAILLDRVRDKLRITEDGRMWLWSGKQWVSGGSDAIARQWVSRVAPEFRELAERLKNEWVASGQELPCRDAIAAERWALALGMTHRQSAVVGALVGSGEIQGKIADFDAMPGMINVQNGVLNLETRQVVPHAPEFLCTKIATVEWDNDLTPARCGRECGVFDKFLGDICCDDADLIGYKMRQWGYCISGYVSEKVLFFHLGTGNNGKSKESELMHAILGEYAKEVSVDVFFEQFGGNNSAEYTLSQLPGVRLTISGELDESKYWNESAIKKMTGGGDSLVAREIRQAPFQFKPKFKSIIHGNNKPRIKTGDEALWARLKLIPYNFIAVEGETMDRHLATKLELEKNYIFYRMVYGFYEWLKCGGLGTCEAVQKSVAEYRDDSTDDLSEFLLDCCEIEDGAETRASDLYDDYLRYCHKKNRKYPRSQQGFGRFLTTKGIEIRKSDGRKVRVGIKLKTSITSDDDVF